MTELADKVACAMRRLADCENTDKDLFNVVLETLRRKYMNATIKPEKQCNAARLCLLFPHRSHPRNAAQALKMVSLSGLEMYMRTMFKVAFVEGLICGNMSREESMQFLNIIVSKLRLPESIPMTKAMEPSFRVVDLATAKSPEKVDQLSSFLYEEESDNPKETNTAIDIYFQMKFCESTYDEEVIYCQIINYLISEKFFDMLRTKEQLGYDVSCDDLHSIGVVGFHFCIKSPSASGAFLEERIECFIERIAQYLTLLPEKHFKRSSESLAKLRLLPPENLCDQTSRFWRQIIDRRYEWNVREREATAIRSAKLPNVVEWFCRNFLNQRKKLTVLVHSNSNLDHGNDSEDMDHCNTEPNESDDSEDTDSDEDEGSACVDMSGDIPVPEIGIFGNPGWWKEQTVKKIKSNDFSAFANSMPLHRTFTT
jgi:secreted Zn-dependent insulinase-like peptidase